MDPSVKTYIDIIFFCPSVWIMFWYRIAHFLYQIRFSFLSLTIMTLVKFFYHIEIHPKAVIGKNVFFDHAIGTVIGETAVIGNNCLIYHNVTLGSLNNVKTKRHPTIGNNVLIGTGATLLGNITIGDNVSIGANATVLKDVQPNQTVVGIYK